MAPHTSLDALDTQHLADLAIRIPGASRVFHRHRLDFCCGGRRSLREACGAAGLDVEALLGELAAEERGAPAHADWDARPLEALIDHIVLHYHAALRLELPALRAMAQKVERVHAEKPQVPRGLAAHLAAMQQDVEEHLAKEEQVLFPLLRAGVSAGAAAPISVLEHEHDEHGEALRITRALTDDLQPPPHACTTWRALYLRLAELERDLMDHIHLENNVLFPRALGR